MIMQKIHDNFIPSSNISIEMYIDDSAFSSQYVSFADKINESIYCDTHWTQSH